MKVVFVMCLLTAFYFLLRVKNKKVKEIKVEEDEPFRYFSESEFKPDVVSVFESPFNSTFESEVYQDLDKNGNPHGYYWTKNPNALCYKATTIRCKLKLK